jgi:hypothetical protein
MHGPGTAGDNGPVAEGKARHAVFSHPGVAQVSPAAAERIRRTDSARASTSAWVLQSASDARTEDSTPNRRRMGWAQ